MDIQHRNSWYAIFYRMHDIFTLRQPSTLVNEESLLHLLYLQNIRFLYDACYIYSETTDTTWLNDLVCCIYLNEDPTNCNFAATYAFIMRFPLIRSGAVSSLVIALPLRWRHNGRDSVSNHEPRDQLRQHLINTKGPHNCPSGRESSGDRWIPRTKDQ